MKRFECVGSAIVLLALSAPIWCGAQETVPSPTGKTPQSPTKSRDALRFTFHLRNTEVAPLLRQMAEAAGVKILISDDVHLWMRTTDLRDATFESALQEIATAMDLAWGKVGPDTYLVTLNRAISKSVSGLLTLPQLHFVPVPDAPVQPNTHDFLAPTPPQNPPSNWQPFHFNGNQYFRVPLK